MNTVLPINSAAITLFTNLSRSGKCYICTWTVFTSTNFGHDTLNSHGIHTVFI